MRFDLVFDNTNDSIPIDVAYNHRLIEWFINQANTQGHNNFFNTDGLAGDVDKKLNDIHWALSKTNEIYWLLSGENFPQNEYLPDYFDQRFLNRQHALWCESHLKQVDIDTLRFSENTRQAVLGEKLHDAYPDEIRCIYMAEAMSKLGYIYPYEEVNEAVHRLEHVFSVSEKNRKGRDFSAPNKYNQFGFENIFKDEIQTFPGISNFSFGYIFVGRHYHNKWKFWDTDLEFSDHYNYDRLQWSFTFNLDRPELFDFSPEYKAWAQSKNLPLCIDHLPIGNIPDLESNLTKYRKMVYHNVKHNNPIRLILK